MNITQSVVAADVLIGRSADRDGGSYTFALLSLTPRFSEVLQRQSKIAQPLQRFIARNENC
jgi:hypothetical protein